MLALSIDSDQVIFKTVTTPDNTNPNAMATEAASCFANDNVIALTTSGRGREHSVKVEHNQQIRSFQVARKPLPKRASHELDRGKARNWETCK
jgi:hypothetical protein